MSSIDTSGAVKTPHITQTNNDEHDKTVNHQKMNQLDHDVFDKSLQDILNKIAAYHDTAMKHLDPHGKVSSHSLHEIKMEPMPILKPSSSLMQAANDTQSSMKATSTLLDKFHKKIEEALGKK